MRDASYLGVDTSIPELENFIPVGGYGDVIPFLSETNTLYLWEINATSWQVYPLPSEVADTSYEIGPFYGNAVFVSDYNSICAVFNVTTHKWTKFPIGQESNYSIYS